jgi:hypothetical protein
MKLTGINDLLPFLNYLRGIRDVPWYRVKHSRDDAITLEIYMPEIRLEIDFFDDHIEYSLFEGDESVFDDQERLFALIEERGK